MVWLVGRGGDGGSILVLLYMETGMTENRTHFRPTGIITTTP